MIAGALSSAGASKIYILGRRLEKLTSAATLHENLIPIQCDITEKASLQAAVERITTDVGYINLLVANSGILGPTASFSSNASIQELRKNMFEDTSMQGFTQTFHVNATATWFTLLAFLELLDEGNKRAVNGGKREGLGAFGAPLILGGKVPAIQSQVIVTSSIAAFLRESMCVPGYAGSKAAIAHLVKHASTGLAAHEIRVNALAPGCMSSFLSFCLRRLLMCMLQGSLLRWLTRLFKAATLRRRVWMIQGSFLCGDSAVRRRWEARCCILRVEWEAFVMAWCWLMMEGGWLSRGALIDLEAHVAGKWG